MNLPLSFPAVAECVPRPEDAAADRQALDALREQVLQANLALPRHGLVLFTWGNVSGVDRARGWMAIKPSGVAYERLQREDIVVLALADGARVAGTLKPSSDTATHLHLYRQWPGIGGIVHTHSTHATAWAQAGLPIPALGTTHADYFHGEVPCSRPLRPDEIARDYEGATGEVIVETLAGRDPAACPGVLVSEHAPFAWGRDAAQAVHHAAVLEEVARLALYTRQLDADRRPIGTALAGQALPAQARPRRDLRPAAARRPHLNRGFLPLLLLLLLPSCSFPPSSSCPSPFPISTAGLSSAPSTCTARRRCSRSAPMPRPCAPA